MRSIPSSSTSGHALAIADGRQRVAGLAGSYIFVEAHDRPDEAKSDPMTTLHPGIAERRRPNP